MKKERHTYESFCRTFAGIYAKHARNGGQYFTCYVREGIERYLDRRDEVKRGVLMERAGRETLIGCKIAYSLLKAGWDEDTILYHTDTQQERVDEAERRASFDEAVMFLYDIQHKPRFANSMNAYRYAWLIDGAPCLEGACDDLLEEKERLHDDYDDDDVFDDC